MTLGRNVGENALQGRISEKGQVTIPKSIREVLKLNTGDMVGFYTTENGVVIRNNSENDSAMFFSMTNRFVKTENVIYVRGNEEFGKSRLISKIVANMYKGGSILIFDTALTYMSMLMEQFITLNKVEVYDKLGAIRVVQDLKDYSEDNLKDLIKEASYILVSERFIEENSFGLDWHFLNSPNEHNKTKENVKIFLEGKELPANWEIIHNQMLDIEIEKPVRSNFDYSTNVSISSLTYSKVDNEDFEDLHVEVLYK